MGQKRTLPENLRSEAEILASRPYLIDLKRDETTDGMPIYLAINPELPGCMAQGATTSEAISNLEEARIEFIQSLLADGLEVPFPARQVADTESVEQTVFVKHISYPQREVDFLDLLEKVSQPEYREEVVEYSVSLVTS
jgi:predicted RNase H-like HicB family nuclease